MLTQIHHKIHKLNRKKTSNHKMQVNNNTKHTWKIILNRPQKMEADLKKNVRGE